MKRIISLISAFTILLTLLSAIPALTGYAAGSSVLNINNKSPKIGDTVTVTATVRANELMLSAEGYVSFNSSVLEFVPDGGITANLVGGRVKLVSTPGATSYTFPLQFRVIGEGTSLISLSEVSYVNNTTDLNAAPISATGSSFNLTVSPATTPDTSSAAPTPSETPSSSVTSTSSTVSSEASLAGITVGNGVLSPTFNPSVTNYTVIVDNSIKKTTVSAVTANGGKVTGTGNVNLSVGDNKRTLTVTAADGKTKKKYIINFRRLTEGEEAPSADTPEAPEESGDVLAVNIDGAAYRISTELSALVLPEGFNATTTSYSGIPVPVYEDGKAEYTLFGLTSDADGTTDFYTYNADTDSFTRLNYAYIDNRFFIFPEHEASAPAGFFEKKIEISGASVAAYAYEAADMTDFSVIYCYYNGKYSYYRYDMREETLQRYPEFEPESISGAISVDNSSSPLSRLSSKAKLVLMAVIIAAVCAIALIILLIVHAVSERKLASSAFSDDSAFDYSFDDAIPFDTVEELSDNSEENKDGE